jgi:predicted Zn-dependent protease
MSKRLAALEKMVAAGTNDPFVHYGLAMEYRSEARLEDALAAFERLRREHSQYLAMYLMAGQLLAELGRVEAAREWLAAGLQVAVAQGDAKARGELGEALDALA